MFKKKNEKERKESSEKFLPALFEIHILPTVRRFKEEKRTRIQNSCSVERSKYFKCFGATVLFFLFAFFSFSFFINMLEHTNTN